MREHLTVLQAASLPVTGVQDAVLARQLQEGTATRARAKALVRRPKAKLREGDLRSGHPIDEVAPRQVADVV